jgi:hypothetical protein
VAKALISCPGTGGPELIEFVDTPLGALIHACSRFRPATALACNRGCARLARCSIEGPCVDFDVTDAPTEKPAP